MKSIIIILFLIPAIMAAEKNGGVTGNISYGDQGVGIGVEAYYYYVSAHFAVLPTFTKPDSLNYFDPIADTNGYKSFGFSRMVYQVGIGAGYDMKNFCRLKASVSYNIEPVKEYLRANGKLGYYNKPTDATRTGFSYGGGIDFFLYEDLIIGLSYDTKIGFIMNYGIRF